jgi:hypothetical protein
VRVTADAHDASRDVVDIAGAPVLEMGEAAACRRLEVDLGEAGVQGLALEVRCQHVLT